MKNCTKVMLGFGSNIGNRIENIKNALELISERFPVSGVSDVYSSRSLLEDTQPDYFNIVAIAYVGCSALELLDFVQGIENDMGRNRNVKRYGERLIDIDIIDFGGMVLDSPRLILPHKDMEYRSFVLYPLLDIYPTYSHPISGRILQDMVAALKNKLNIIKIANSASLSFQKYID